VLTQASLAPAYVTPKPGALRLFARESDLWNMRPRRLLDIVGLCEFVRPSIVPQLELGDASLSSVFEILTGDVLGARVPEELTRQYNSDTVVWNEKHRVRNCKLGRLEIRDEHKVGKGGDVLTRWVGGRRRE